MPPAARRHRHEAGTLGLRGHGAARPGRREYKTHAAPPLHRQRLAGRHYRQHDPGRGPEHGRGVRHSGPGHLRRRRAGGGLGAGGDGRDVRGPLGTPARGPARAPHGAAGSGRDRTRRGIRAPRGPRHRQVAQDRAGRRRGPGPLLRILRRRLRQAARRDPALRTGLHGAHHSRAARRDRAHHPVELPDADLRAHRRRVARGRQRLRGEAGRRCQPVDSPSRRTGRRDRLPRRHAQRGHRLRARGGCRPHRASRHRPHLLHRLHRDRTARGRGGRETSLPRDAGTRRQVAAARLRRRRPRGRPARDRQRHHPECRADLLGREPSARAARRLRAAACAAGRAVQRAPRRSARPRTRDGAAREPEAVPTWCGASSRRPKPRASR